MIDTNVWLSRWPFRRLPLDETPRLIESLRQRGVTQAWAGSFDMLLHRDISSVNARLAEECRNSEGFLIPFGAINPALPGWKEDLRRCAEQHGMRGLRLTPNYHRYELSDPRFIELLDHAADQRLIVQMALRMEDDRTQHPLVAVPDVNPAPLLKLVADRPALRVMIINGLRTLSGEPLAKLALTGRVWFEISMQEGAAGLESLQKLVPLERIAFGTYAPFFVPESALLKLKESELAEGQRAAIESRNALALWQDR